MLKGFARGSMGFAMGAEAKGMKGRKGDPKPKTLNPHTPLPKPFEFIASPLKSLQTI